MNTLSMNQNVHQILKLDKKGTSEKTLFYLARDLIAEGPADAATLCWFIPPSLIHCNTAPLALRTPKSPSLANCDHFLFLTTQTESPLPLTKRVPDPALD